jgi:hypothetical protein
VKRVKQPARRLEALPGLSILLDRLDTVRKRKRAYGGQTVDMVAIQRRIAQGQKRQRGW